MKNFMCIIYLGNSHAMPSLISLKNNLKTRIPRIRRVTCLKHHPFDMKKEKNNEFVPIITLIPKGNASLLCLNFINQVNKGLYLDTNFLDDYQNQT